MPRRNPRVAIVINPMKEFAGIDWSAAAKTRVLDPWRCLCPGGSARDWHLRGAWSRQNDRSVRDWLSGELKERMRLLNG